MPPNFVNQAMALGKSLTGIGSALALSCSAAQFSNEGDKPLSPIKAQPQDYEDGRSDCL